MGAVISIVQNWGFASASYFGEVAKNISNILSIDDGLANKEDNPVRIPISGTNYSFETWIRLRCDLAPDGVVNNIKAWYISGVPSPGYLLTVNNSVVSDYNQPVDTQSVRGTRVDFTEHDSEENAIELDGELSEIGDYSSWLVFQLEITNNAQLDNGHVDYFIQYDES